VEMDRINTPLKIDPIEWPDINTVIQDLRDRHTATNRGEPTHPGTEPRPKK